MSLVTVAGLVMVIMTIYVMIINVKGRPVSHLLIRSIPVAGSTAFFLGLLAQVLGLYQAMTAIQAAGDISPALVAGGFQVSLIAPIYGLIIFVISLIVYLLINFWSASEDVSE